MQQSRGRSAKPKNGRQVSPDGPVKKRDRNFHPELRILASRASEEERRGRSKSPVTKHPLDSSAFRFASREITSQNASDTRTADTDESSRSEDGLRIEPSLSRRQSDNKQSGNVNQSTPPTNHPLLMKDRTTLLKENFKVRFIDEMSVRSSASSDLRDTTTAASTGSKAVRPKKSGLKNSTTSAFGCGFIPPDEISIKQARKRASALTIILNKLKCTRDTTISDDEDFDLRTANELVALKATDCDEVQSYIKKSSSSSSSSRLSQIEQKLKTFQKGSKLALLAKGDNQQPKKKIPEEIKRNITINLAEGDLFAHEENFEEAVQCYMHALEASIDSVNDGCEIDLDVFRTVENLRDCYHKYTSLQNSDAILAMGQEQENCGRFMRAVKFYTVAYRIRRDTLGDRHPSLIKLLNVMGSLQTKRGHIEDAMTFVEMAEELQAESNAGLVTMAVTARNKGTVFEYAGKYSQALDCYHESFRLHRLSRGVEWDLKSVSFPQASKSVRKDPLLFELVKKPDWLDIKAGHETEEGMEVTMESSLCYYNVSLSEKVQSKDVLDEIDANVDLAMTLHSIGRILARYFKRYLLAMNAYTSSLDWMKNSLGSDHPNIAALFGNIGNVCLEMEAYDRAYLFYQEVLRVEEKCFGKRHPEIAVTLFNIGTIEYARGHYENAIKAFQSTMKIQKSVFGVDSAVIGLASHSVAEVCERCGDYKQALQSYKVALEIDQLTMGKEHAQVGHLLHKMGKLCYQHLNDLNEADVYCRRAKEVYVTLNSFPETSLVVRTLYGDLANIKALQDLQPKVKTSPGQTQNEKRE